MTLMYHPTPTLEDLGLTSYLDSPPSSLRTRSPAREEKTVDCQPERESARRVLPAWDAPTNDFFDQESKPTNSQAREFRTAVSAHKQSSKTDTVSEAKISTLNVTNQMSERHQTNVTNQMIERHQAYVTNQRSERHQANVTNQMIERHRANVTNQMSERHQAASHTQMNKHLATNVESQRYVPSFAPKGWDPTNKSSKSLQGPASTESVINVTSRPATFTAPISKSVTGPDVKPTNNKRPGSGSTLAENPEKRACNWSMIAEQYSTESRHSVNQEQRRDALYRRYNKDERQQTHTTKRHQNHDAMYQEHTDVPSRNQTFDQVLAEQIARQAELKSQNHNQAPQTGTSVNEKRRMCQPMTKSSLPTVNMDDLFGGLSPYSC
ncbi:uncharacterized protein LOC134257735 [Saccostrea cucullata]|uniref:uncharacterized protein LOC134257735 n=1 Tax=Saccostrea cuccullata TaxID=36930 RepID=UPI002ED3D507